MKENDTYPHNQEQDGLIDQINGLTDQVKTLALNLAITLAREKKQIKDLTLLEPEFTKLINGSVDVIREISEILKALQGDRKDSDLKNLDNRNLSRIEGSLNEIHNLSRNVLKAVAAIKKGKSKVDNYK
jgi:methyl-accepting chemotaxis protein